METIETEITNRIGANINNKFDGSAGQWPSSVAIDTHTLIGLGREIDIINRLNEMQVVIKKFFLEIAN